MYKTSMNKIEPTVVKSIYFRTNEDVKKNVNKLFKLVSDSIVSENYKCFKNWSKYYSFEYNQMWKI